MSRLFISYAHVDKRQVRELAEILQDGGHEAWFDHSLVVGRDWKDQLLEEITRCDAFVYALTPESVNSEWCQWEFEQAVLLGKPIIPVLMQKNTILPDALKQYQYADFSDGPTAKSTAKLLHGVYAMAVTIPIDTLPEKLAEPQGVPENMREDFYPAIEIVFDVGQAMTLFYEAKKNGDWYRADEMLDEIETYGNAPTWFRLDQLRAEIQPEVERLREIERLQNERLTAERHQQERDTAMREQYDLIRLMARHDNPVRVWDALQDFLASFSYYDPDNLTAKFRPLTSEQKNLLDLIADYSSKPTERAEAGRRLAEIDDPRRGIGLRLDGIPDIDWVEVPSGEFVLGRDNKVSQGLLHQKLYLDTFYIARYPVTYAQFQAFVEDNNGIKHDRWWDGLALRQKKLSKQTWPIANHPRENVSWYQAIAFCRWLSAHLGYEVTLPTEQQWEKAARGTDGQFYPWGNEYISGYANIDELYNNVGPYYLERTTSVGIYPQGASPYNVLDMIGNVWEWCLTAFDTGHIDTTCSDSRVLCGNSWINRTSYMPMSYYSGASPDYKNSLIGFRCVCHR